MSKASVGSCRVTATTDVCWPTKQQPTAVYFSFNIEEVMSHVPKLFTYVSSILTISICSNGLQLLNVVEAHCYFVNIGRTDSEQICSRMNNNNCRTFRPRRPLSNAYKHFVRSWQRSIWPKCLAIIVIDSATYVHICSQSVRPITTTCSSLELNAHHSVHQVSFLDIVYESRQIWLCNINSHFALYSYLVIIHKRLWRK